MEGGDVLFAWAELADLEDLAFLDLAGGRRRFGGRRAGRKGVTGRRVKTESRTRERGRLEVVLNVFRQKVSRRRGGPGQRRMRSNGRDDGELGRNGELGTLD